MSYFFVKGLILSYKDQRSLIKFVNNTFRDVRFAFSNEIALICSRFNLDAVKIIEAANFGYPRGGVPYPSPGVGGYCLTKDGYLLIDALKKSSIYLPYRVLLREVLPGARPQATFRS